MRIDRENPCKPGSAARKIVGVLMNSRKRSLAATEIAFRAKINTRKVVQVVSALLNPYHNASIAKAGLAVKRTHDGGITVEAIRPRPKAHRPPPKQAASPSESIESVPSSMEAVA